MKSPYEILNSTRADEIAEKLPVEITPSDLATKARKVIRTTGFRTLPVTRGGNLTGALRLKDLLKITSAHSNIKVSGLMRPSTLTVTPNWKADEVARKAIEKDLHSVPVIKSQTNKSLVGLIRLEEILGEIAENCGEYPKVEEIMTRDTITTSPEDRLSKVWNLMEKSNITGVPVVKESKPVGMITRGDIIKSGRARIASESNKGRVPPKVKTIVQGPPVSVSPEDSIGEAARTMDKYSIGRLPVTEDERLIGIVDREDVIRPYL